MLSTVSRLSMLISVMLIIAISCSDDAPNDPSFSSNDLEYKVGDRLVYRTTYTVEGEEPSVELDTQEVALTSSMEGASEVQWNDGTRWRVSNDTFYIGSSGTPVHWITFGLSPAPLGRWSEPVYTIPRTAEDGTVLSLWYCIYETTATDEPVSVPAGTFRCATVTYHFEDEEGRIVDGMGSGSISYSVGTGLIRHITNGMGYVNQEKRPSQRVMELFQLDR